MMKNDKGINISAEISSLMNDSIGEYYNTGEVDNNEYKEDNYLCFYKIVRLLGTGSSSKVVLGVNTINNEQVAIKIIKRKKNHIFDKSDYRIFREVLITTLINHPYIVRLKDFMFNDQNYFLIFEYVAGKQLYDVIVNDGYLNESIARRYFRQILSAIDFIHRNSIVHRDLKIENILLDEFDNIKIIDFGLSNFYDNKSTLNTFCGSLYFAAPELLLGQRYSGPEIDVWSLGVILFVLLNGTVPFDDKDVEKLQEKIQLGKFSFSMNFSSSAKELILKMLHVDPKHRHTLEEILFSDWVNMEHDIPVNNYFIPQYPIDRINSSIIKNLSIILKFQFKNMEREIFRFFDVCLKDKKLLQLEYWTNRPIISLYFMMLEYFGDENCNDSLNDIRIEMEEDSLVSDIIFSDDKISYLKNLHYFVASIIQKDTRSPCSKFFKQKVFKDVSTKEPKLFNNPKIKNTYLKGIFRGIKLKNIGSHNALKKILIDIFKKNRLNVKTDEKYFICDVSYNESTFVSFKVSLYFNVILGEYYVNLTHVSGERKEFRRYYDIMYNDIKELKVL